MSRQTSDFQNDPNAWVLDALRRRVSDLQLQNDALEKRVQQRNTEAEVRARQLRALALDLANTESRERKRLATLLHDHFQQLVSAAKLKTGLVRRASTDPKAVATLKHAEELLEEALDASRTLATELSPQVLNDGGLIPALQWLARKMESDYGLHVAIDCEPAAEPESEQVRTLLFECTRELLFNVVKHAHTDHAAVSLKMPSRGLLTLTVSDKGKGFDGNLNLSRSGETSFGLFSIRERLSFIGGLLYIRSAPGQGAAMEMSVPVGAATRAISETAIAFPTLTTPKLPAPLDRPARIVVVDDHKLFREGVIHLLSQEPDLTVIGQAADGVEAIEVAKDLKPDVLILDVSMPKMTGIQAAAEISRSVPGIRMIGLSMHDDPEIAAAMRAAGAYAYLSKSTAAETLIDTVRSLVSAKPHTCFPHAPSAPARAAFQPTADSPQSAAEAQ